MATNSVRPGEIIEALVFPADGRKPTLLPLPTSEAAPQYFYNVYSHDVSTVPHPELLMDYVLESLGTSACQHQRVEALDEMTTKLEQPFAIFYPVASRDNMPFSVNQCVREIQQGRGLLQRPWRGDLVVVKYQDYTYTKLTSAKMADFPIIKNYFLTHEGPY